MPNLQNVASPINIHGVGRSGTTLLQNILGVTGFIQVCNETNGFVFCSYRGGEVLNPSHDKQAAGARDAIATRALHAGLCAAMPSSKPSWCQKLGGIPNSVVWGDLIDDADRRYASDPYPFPYGWFWRVLSHAFPHSMDVLIVRDYRDIIVSRSRFSGYLATSVAQDTAVYFNIMAHPASRIDHIVRFETLVSTPQAAISTLFDALGLTYADDLLQAMEWHAAPSPDRRLADARDAQFSWRDEYGTVLDTQSHDIMAPAIGRLVTRFGLDPADLGPNSAP